VTPRSSGPQLAALQIADAPAAWEALGFTISDDGLVILGGVELWLDAGGRGITGWTLRGLGRRGDIDGLPTGQTTDPSPPDVAHANGAIGIDQVVITTSDFDRTAAALEEFGMPLRRVVELDDARAAQPGEAGGRASGKRAGGFRQGFRRLGPAILELVEVVDGPPGPARFWGLVVIVPDVFALRDRLAPLVGEVRDAVQPGRHMAALSDAVGIGPRLAFMDPEPA
jgi:hypothetical protein